MKNAITKFQALGFKQYVNGNEVRYVKSHEYSTDVVKFEIIGDQVVFEAYSTCSVGSYALAIGYKLHDAIKKQIAEMRRSVVD